MVRAIAINVGANSTLPGFRGPIHPDGSFEYVPIPEREATRESVPTYADLDLSVDVPAEVRDRRVHLDPEFREYPRGEAYTYGDEHGVKAGPISDLDTGDHLLFYATLSPSAAPDREWIAPDWGAYLVGRFELARDPVTGEEYRDLPPAEREAFASNAHVKRDPFDARVLVRGTDDSELFETAVPLSTPEGGADPNRLVTEYSADSGKGPWWRRPLRFDRDATTALLDACDAADPTPWL